MKTFRKTLALFSPNERRRALLVLLLVVGMALLETAGVASIMPFLAVLGDPELLKTNSGLSALYSFVQLFGIRTVDEFLIAFGFGAFALIIFSAVYRTFTLYVMNRFVEMRRHSIGSRLLATYLRQPYAFFLHRHSGEMTKTILSEVDQLMYNVIRPTFNIISYSTVFVALLMLLFIVNPRLALFAIAPVAGFYALVFLVLKNKLVRLGEKQKDANQRRFKAATETLNGIKVIKVFGREQVFLDQFNVPSRAFALSISANQTLLSVPKYIVEATAIGGVIVMILVLMISEGGLSNNAVGKILPIIGLYVFAAYRMQPALQNVFSGFSSLRYGQAALNNIYNDLFQGDPLAKYSVSTQRSFIAKDNITLQNLSYTYQESSRPALNNLNLEIKVGSSLGLVGSTGSGKTTLVDVLLGLLRPTHGAIIVDGVKVTEDRVRSWQNSIGYVPQDIFLTDSSISENIALGISKSHIDQSQVERCARMAQVHDFIINELSSQYETCVGERGVRLSGGQRQRIGIARALYHNPEVLVFDEATSALDVITERAVMNAIDSLQQLKTIIFIAHRLSTVKNCDQIIILEQGVIKAKGSFGDLIKNNDLFSEVNKI